MAEINITNLTEKLNSVVNIPEDYFTNETDYKIFMDLVDLVKQKDEYIMNLNNIVQRHVNVIKDQISEIATLNQEIINYQFYPAHPKDDYKINFGHTAWRGWSYRFCVSSRQGKKICSWILNKTTTNTPAMKEFLRYLKAVSYPNA